MSFDVAYSHESTAAPRVGGQLRHEGPCGVRIPCWREECRRTYAPYSTIEVLVMAAPPDPLFDLVAYCHRDKVRAGELSPHIWNYIADVVGATW